MSIAEFGVESGPERGQKAAGIPDAVGLYLHDIKQFPIIGEREDQVVCFKVIEAGWEARDRLKAIGDAEVEADFVERRQLQLDVETGEKTANYVFECNTPLVVNIARKYKIPDGLEFGDLIGAGNLGLHHAITKFEWQKGFMFSTYATFWIRQAIGRYIDQKGSVVPFLDPATMKAARKHGEDALTPNQQAKLAKYKSRFSSGNPVSLDDTLGSDTETTHAERIADQSTDTMYERAEDSTVLKTAFDGLRGFLDSIEIDIIVRQSGINNNGEPESMADIARIHGMKPSMVRNLRMRAMSKLYHPANAHIVSTIDTGANVPEWTEDAACYGEGSEAFMAPRGGSLKGPKEKCQTCDVLPQCEELVKSMPRRTIGFWAGTSERQRNRPGKTSTGTSIAVVAEPAD